MEIIVKEAIDGLMAIADISCTCDTNVGFICEMHNWMSDIQREFYYKDKQIETLKAEIDLLNKQLEAAMCDYEKEADRNYVYKELADFQAFVEKQERIAGQGNDMDYVDGCNFTIGLVNIFTRRTNKRNRIMNKQQLTKALKDMGVEAYIEHISPLCKVLDEAKYVFGDDKNIDIDEICQYIRNAYIAESEVEE